MKIAILGSAPSSLHLAPFGDPSWKIWGCSPGVYAALSRCDAFFELHRWEPGLVGKPHTQKQWFSPEYVAWMGQRDPQECPVWMYQPVPEIPASRALPIEDIKAKYGTYFLTSSISIMLACAIEDILEARESGADEDHAIGLFGVDMAATEEYGYQRAGCQHFLELAANLGIQIVVPPESDLLRPMPVYGICESSHWMIKNTARKRELEGRLAQANAQMAQARDAVNFLNGALDDLNYQMLTWGEDREGTGTSFGILAKSPHIHREIMDKQYPEDSSAQPCTVFEEAGPVDPKAFVNLPKTKYVSPVCLGDMENVPQPKPRLE